MEAADVRARLAMYLQEQFPEHHVDCEYNRAGNTPKRLNVPAECANGRDDNGEALVVPDVIVHRRGTEGPNVLVLELKKASNPEPRACDRARIHGFRDHLAYEFGVLIECETRAGREPAAVVAEWLGCVPVGQRRHRRRPMALNLVTARAQRSLRALDPGAESAVRTGTRSAS